MLARAPHLVPLLLLLGAPAAAQLPAGFQNQLVVSGLDSPVSIEFLPDGRALILEKGGTIRSLGPGATQLDPSPYLALPDVEDGGERGLLDIAVDPAFAANGRFYLYYTNASSARNRVSRFTEVGGVGSLASETVLWEDNEPFSSCCHYGGGLDFGPDGNLWLTTGEEFDGIQAQALTRSGGKLLRFAPDGSIPADNPFRDGPGGNDDAIWGLGLRNPFRASWDLVGERLFIGEVGGNNQQLAREDIHAIHLHGPAGGEMHTHGPETEPGVNFGWPNCEGYCGNRFYEDPVYSYPHEGLGAAVIGGVAYRGTQFPGPYWGAYFYGDYVRGWISYLTFDANGQVVSSSMFEPEAGYELVAIEEGPDGSLWYVLLSGSVRRITFQGGNLAPLIQSATADVTSGPGPTLQVAFSGSATDNEGDPLTYRWVFGDGSEATGAQVQHTYVSRGVYQARLEVSDAFHTSVSEPIPISVGNAPQITILSPEDGSLFVGGETIVLEGTATDADEVLGDANYSWRIVFHHNEHTHPGEGAIDGASLASFPVPTSEHDFHDDTSFEIVLTVTDSDGLSTSDSVFVFPDKVDVTFDTVPSGLTLSLDSIPRTTPFVYDTLKGFRHDVAVATAQCAGGTQYAFQAWSDGGAAAHEYTVPNADASLVATFAAGGPCSLTVPGQIASYRFRESSGSVVHDVSGFGSPLNLTIESGGATAWLAGGGLAVTAPTVITSGAPANKVSSAIRTSQQLTVEAWIRPASAVQGGPARIVALSQDGFPTGGNFVLSQKDATPPNSFEMRCRTTLTDGYGLPGFTTPAGTTTTDLTHLAYTRDAAGIVSFFVDGTLVRTGSIGGSLASWDPSYPLTLANEPPGDRPWLGELYGVAIYDRALTQAEVAQNFVAGHDSPANLPPRAAFTAVPRTGAAPLAVAFDASPSSDPDGSLSSFGWDFGDGSFGSGATASHVYALPGEYTVVLTVTDDGFAADSSALTVQVDPPPQPVVFEEPADAAVLAGQTAAFQVAAQGAQPIAYQWRRDGVPIPGATSAVHTTAPVAIGDDGALYSCVVSNAFGSDQSRDATLTVVQPGTRVTAGQVAAYEFTEGGGTTVHDDSGHGAPLDLVVDDPAAVRWLPGRGLAVDASTTIASLGHATKIVDAVRGSGELSLEVWMRTDDLLQGGPARIVALSQDGFPNGGNVVLGQEPRPGGARHQVRFRSSTTDQYGLPGLAGPAGSLGTDLTHVVYTRAVGGATRLYVGGSAVATGTTGGNLSGWNELYHLVLANEPPGDRPWIGELYLVAFFDRALAPEEVAHNALAVPVGAPNLPPTAVAAATPTSGPAPLQVAFDGSASFDGDGTVVAWDWDFGDGSGAQGALANHVYAAVGSYVATLEVTDDGGARATDTVAITVSASPLPRIVAQPVDQTVQESGAATFTVTAEGQPPLAYQWFRDGVAIPGATTPSHVTQPASAADDGARFACRVSNAAGEDLSDEATLMVLPAGARVLEGLVLLYGFGEGSGSTVADLSGATPALDLTIADPGAVTWLPSGGLAVDAPTVLRTGVPATRLRSAFLASGELTLEAWLRPANTTQSGPARVVALSRDGFPNGGNLILSQEVGASFGARYQARLRSQGTNQYGLPAIVSPPSSLSTDLTHVVFTRGTGGTTRLYLDGVQVASGSTPGALTSWGDYELVLANEPPGDRPWLGDLRLVAAYARALSPEEVAQNHAAGPSTTPNDAPVPSIAASATSGVAPLAVDFDGSASHDPDGTIVAWDWDFGDGSTRSGALASHTYAVAGSFSAVLTVTDDQGGRASASLWVVVDPPPLPSIVVQPQDRSVAQGASATFSVVAQGAAPLAYQWTRDGAPVPGATQAAYTTPPVDLADDGALLRCEVSNASGSVVSDPALLTVLAADPRVTQGQVLLYTFSAGAGSVVADVSGGGTPLDLAIADPGAVTWLPGGGLSIDAPTVLASAGPATALVQSLRATRALTVEAWLRPANTTQGGPARFFALSQDGFPAGGNLVLGQDATAQGSRYQARLRTMTTNQYGLPGLATPAGSLTTDLTHVVFTRDAAGATTLYLDGAPISSGLRIGDFSNWGDYVLALANEPTADRAWLGELHLVAVFQRALDAAEVDQNFRAGPGTAGN